MSNNFHTDQIDNFTTRVWWALIEEVAITTDSRLADRDPLGLGSPLMGSGSME